MKNYITYFFLCLLSAPISLLALQDNTGIAPKSILNGTMWVHYGDDDSKSGKESFIIIFKDNYYAVINQSIHGDFCTPKYKVEFKSENKPDHVLVMPDSSTHYSDMKVYMNKKYLVIQGSHKSSEITCKQIKYTDCDALLKNFKLSDINFQNLPVFSGKLNKDLFL